MSQRLIWRLTVLFLFCPALVHAAEVPKIILLPFAINAEGDLGYLEAEIPKLIGDALAREGADLIPAAPDVQAGLDDTAARRVGLVGGAEYVLWGNFTRIGQRFSLDAKLLYTLSQTAAQAFYTEGTGLENLIGAIQSLARDIALSLFKRQRITAIEIKGNRRIEADAIERVIKTQVGDIFSRQALSQDLREIYAMGYFDDIRIETSPTPQGQRVVIQVKEKPTIRIITFRGNSVYDDEKILENLDIRTGSILNIFKVQKNIARIEDLYRDKNYHNVTVRYEIVERENNQSELAFLIDEGEKVRIKSISFEGNNAYKAKALKKIMKTSEKGFFSWITSSGELNRDNLKQDAGRITAFYHNSGYIQARVGEPVVEFKDDWIYITVKIDEGPRFTVGEVDIAGDIVLTKEDLLKSLKITDEEYYNRETVRNDVLVLTDLYSDEGYAYADVFPKIDQDLENFKVDITYTAKKGTQVYFEKITIGGNTRTRDKVIRRELPIYEQGLYSGKRMKRGVRNLYRLDFFEEIKLDTRKGSAEDKMLVSLEVKEKPTGILSFGGGYSTLENAFLVTSITQRNLFGRAQKLQLKAELGSRTTRFSLGFTEPWLFDIPLAAGFDLYNLTRSYDDYDKDSMGGGIRFSYPILDWTRFYITYQYDVSDIRDIGPEASESIQELEGTNVTSSVTASVRYDSRDRIFNPTEGANHSISVEYAGLGGDIGFTKYVAEGGWYFPLFWNTIGFFHAKTGYVRETPGKILPDYERFYLGGINSLRGFDWRDLSPVDATGAEIGGDKFVQFNFEYLIPIFKDTGVVGVLFFDTGDVYDNDEDIELGNLRESIGAGFRWYSPLGPIRIEYGYILDPQPGEDDGGRWEFTMGSAF